MHNPRSAGRGTVVRCQLLAALVTRHRIGIVAASVVMVLAAAGGFYVIGELERARPDPSKHCIHLAREPDRKPADDEWQSATGDDFA